LSIWEATLGPDSPELATTLDNLAVIYATLDQFTEAEPLYRRALALRQKTTVQSWNNLALVLEARGDAPGAERLYQRAVTLAAQIPSLAGPANVGEGQLLAVTLRNYASLLRRLKRVPEAARMEARAKALGKTVAN
jgi:tetratricopeptide (TPR) repeat protein